MTTVEARPVLHGQRVKWTLEQIERENQQKVRLDWLRFTVPLDAVVSKERSLEKLTGGDLTVQAGYDVKVRSAGQGEGVYSAAHMVALAAARQFVALTACGLVVGAVEDRGMDFYAVRVALMHESAVVGYVMAGSKDQRQASTVHFNLFGQGMLVMPRDRMPRIRDFVSQAQGWITRVDLAVDVWSGYRVEDVQTAWATGEFDVRGKRPGQRNAGSWAAGHSRTFYVGNRATGKELRCYEKGDEQFGSREAAAQHDCAEWLRYEVELRNNHRVIDLDVLTRPADFFAGAYAFCARLLDELEAGAVAQSIKTNPELADATALAAAERVASWTDGTCGAIVAAIFQHGGDLLAQIVERNAHRVARRFKAFSTADISAAFEKVAARMTPAPAPLLTGV